MALVARAVYRPQCMPKIAWAACRLCWCVGARDNCTRGVGHLPAHPAHVCPSSGAVVWPCAVPVLVPACEHLRRRLSTGAGQGAGKRGATEAQVSELSQLDKLKLNAPTYAAIAGGVLVVYGVSKTGAWTLVLAEPARASASDASAA